MTGLYVVVWAVASLGVLASVVYLHRARTRSTRPALDDTQPIDVVDSAFADYQRSVVDILDANPARRDELVRRLEAATAEWEAAEFNAAIRPLRRDIRFRFAVRAVLRDSRRTRT